MDEQIIKYISLVPSLDPGISPCHLIETNPEDDEERLERVIGVIHHCEMALASCKCAPNVHPGLILTVVFVDQLLRI